MRTSTLLLLSAPRFDARRLLLLSLLAASVQISSGCSTVPAGQRIEEADLPTIPATLLLPANRVVPPLEPSARDGSATELEVIIAETDCRLVIDDVADQLDALILAVQAYVEAVLARDARRTAPAERKRAWRWPW